MHFPKSRVYQSTTFHTQFLRALYHTGSKCKLHQDSSELLRISFKKKLDQPIYVTELTILMSSSFKSE